MTGILSLILDIVLIGLLSAAILYAFRLSQQIAGLSSSREEMERFIIDFSSTVERAEAGVRGLKQAARSSGDDLEQLIGQARSLRDELQLLVTSADKIAGRLSDVGVLASRVSALAGEPEEKAVDAGRDSLSKAISSIASVHDEEQTAGEGFSVDTKTTAERELLQALKKSGK